MFVAVVLVVVVGSYLILPALFAPLLPATVVGRGSLVQTIVASGRVETPLRVEIGVQVTGTVAAIPVSQGQRVAAGQTLIVLDAGEAKAVVEQAQAGVQQAAARLKQIAEVGLPGARQTARQAEVTLENVQRQYRRTVQLQAQGFVGEAQLDDVRRSLDIARSQLRAARLQVTTSEAQGSDVLLARAALQQAQATLRLANARFEYTRITAPLEGILITRSVERGDVVQPGKALMVLSPFGQTQLVVQIDERNLSYLRPGQPALASADAYPAQRFAAELFYINPGIDPQRGTVEVKFRVATPPGYLRQDMTVSVDVEVAHRDNAIVVPADAVHGIGTPAAWVWVAAANRVQRRAVQTGVRGSGLLEIAAGLQPGEQVLSGAAAGIVEGARVRTHVSGTSGGGGNDNSSNNPAGP